jgi:AcrR family transcriptional regulator
LLTAAARLLKQGRKPTIEEVAEEALVSRATAYRYFPNVDALLVEAPLDSEVPDPQELFGNDTSLDPEERISKAEAALHEVVWRNGGLLRLMLAHSLPNTKGDGAAATVPARQDRRTPLIEAALAPARNRLKKTSYKKLCAALALVLGTESMIVFQDVLQVDEKTAAAVKDWAVRALVRAALNE